MSGDQKKKAARKDADESDGSDESGDLDDEEVSLGSMDEEDFGEEVGGEGGTFMGDEDEDVPELEDDIGDNDKDVPFDEDDAPDVTPPSKKVKRKSSQMELDFSQSFASKAGKKKKKGEKGAAMFAMAQEFGCLLDDNAGAKIDNIGLNAMANTDKAGVKQLKWESQRDDWIHDRDAKTLRRKKATFNKRKRFGRGVKTTTVMMGNKRKRK